MSTLVCRGLRPADVGMRTTGVRQAELRLRRRVLAESATPAV